MRRLATAPTQHSQPAQGAERAGAHSKLRVSGRVRKVWLYLRAIVPALVLWQVVAIAVANPIILPSPVAVVQGLIDLLVGGPLLPAIGASVMRLIVGYGVAAVICIPLGLFMGLSRTLRFLVDPIVEVLRPISGIAWIPLALVLLGVGNSLVIFIIFYGCAFPMLLNTIAGVRQVDEHLVQAAKTFGVSRVGVIRSVVIPSALPMILVGARTAAGTGWMSLVAAELVGTSIGVGFSIEYYRQLLMSPYMFGSIVMIGFLGLMTNAGLRGLQRWLTPWAAKDT